jgi:hypothetical protein
MVTPTDCGWDWSGDYFGPSLRDHLHALGVVALNYNALEISFYLLFCEYVGYSEVSAQLFSDMKNNFRLETLKATAIKQEKNVAVIDAIGTFVGAFDICALNRNILMHSVHDLVQDGDSVLKLLKSNRKDPMKQTNLVFDVRTLRQVADEIWTLDQYAVDLAFYLQTRSGAMPADDEFARTTLPDKPAPPRNLSSLLDPSTRAKLDRPGPPQG